MTAPLVAQAVHPAFDADGLYLVEIEMPVAMRLATGIIKEKGDTAATVFVVVDGLLMGCKVVPIDHTDAARAMFRDLAVRVHKVHADGMHYLRELPEDFRKGKG